VTDSIQVHHNEALKLAVQCLSILCVLDARRTLVFRITWLKTQHFYFYNYSGNMTRSARMRPGRMLLTLPCCHVLVRNTCRERTEDTECVRDAQSHTRSSRVVGLFYNYIHLVFTCSNVYYFTYFEPRVMSGFCLTIITCRAGVTEAGS